MTTDLCKDESGSNHQHKTGHQGLAKETGGECVTAEVHAKLK